MTIDPLEPVILGLDRNARAGVAGAAEALRAVAAGDPGRLPSSMARLTRRQLELECAMLAQAVLSMAVALTGDAEDARARTLEAADHLDPTRADGSL